MNDSINVRGVHSTMLQRCYNPKRVKYKDYGGRGIKVCEEWHDYETFRAWAVESGYKQNLQIDRIDVNGDYEPSNCRWVTNKENCRNRRSTIFLAIGSETKCVAEWCEIVGISPFTAYWWIREKGKEYATHRIKEKLTAESL